MGKLVLGRRPWLIVTSGILLLSALPIYLLTHVSKKARAPQVPVLSVCKQLAPGMRRIGGRSGLQFDVPSEDLTVHEGTTDAAPWVHAFDLRLKNSRSLFEISFGPRLKAEVDPKRIFSTYVEKRTIFNDKGGAVGEDDWGSLRSGERWRQLRFGRGARAEYGFVNEKEAKLFDEVINSACLSPTAEP